MPYIKSKAGRPPGAGGGGASNAIRILEDTIQYNYIYDNNTH
eukprot:COSAG03_NODE_2869_length_2390_cov_7.112615_3_plen_42_part_00